MLRRPAVILALLTGLNLLNYLDRFVLSAGHGSMLLYAVLYLTRTGGDEALTIDDLKAFRQLGSRPVAAHLKQGQQPQQPGGGL